MSKNTNENQDSIDCNYNLETDFNKSLCKTNLYSNTCNAFLLKKELVEKKCLEETPDENTLYPNLNDSLFNLKIANKKEFSETKYDGTIHNNIKEYADLLSNAEFELQPHQAFVKNFLSSQTPYNSLLLYHGLGTGKCLKIDTPLIMSDGSIKMVQDVNVGDLLMGDDSKPRTVLSLARGRDKMYDIIPANGETYTVNKEHILCLKADEFPKWSCVAVDSLFKIQWIEDNTFNYKTFPFSDNPAEAIIAAGQFFENIMRNKKTNQSIIEIAVKDYLELPEQTKVILKGYKVPINFPEKELPSDPYKFGYLGKMPSIPQVYKCNSINNRLQLLAGVIDSTGYLHVEGVKIDNAPEKWTNDVIYLARSLGFVCYKTTEGLILNGKGVEKIPTKLINILPNTQDSQTTIRVEYVNDDEYYGFTLDGNCRFMLGDFTVTHNTCSAIGVCEEMRDYLKQLGIHKRIIVVASENVQDNFKVQLFDEKKLRLVDGVWNIKACTGNKLIKEINPMNMKGIPREKIIQQIKAIINYSYLFLGYGQFANYIIKIIHADEIVEKKQDQIKQPKGEIKLQLTKKIIRRLQNEFNNRLIVIDEIHNIRKSEDNENKKVAIQLEYLVKAAANLRFLLLSATPMYNNYKEIVWLLNLMNLNDRRGKIETKDIFDKNGDFKEAGEELLIRKATGYISFVRGENPYTFPYRVYPNDFAKNNTFPQVQYPEYQMNHKKIKAVDKTRILSLYLNTIGNCQNCGKCQYCNYSYVISVLRNKSFNITTKTGIVRAMPNFENMETFGFKVLQIPLECLIVSYPIEGLKNILDNQKEVYSNEFETFSENESVENESVENELDTSQNAGAESKELNIDPHDLTGKKGLKRMMDFEDNKERTPFFKGNFEYKKSTIEKYGRIFSRKEIGKYSSKIKSILDNIYSDSVSEGVLLVYCQYIDSGLIPVALALEEMGFTRFGKDTKPLFKKAPSEIVDVRTMLPPKDKRDKNFMPARYAMITGDRRLSPNNDFEIKGITDINNKDGNKVKVILISKAGSEGIDLKFIRQVHILDPWYNMNLMEQIIGRAVRNFSHKDLPFEKRNVEIFMHGTILGENKEEAADLYVYRVAELKAIQIGKITRLLKETAVDCIIHHDQTNFTQEILNANLEPITQELSNGQVITNFKIGDAPFSPACDYMATCNYDCRPDKIDYDNLNEDTYNDSFILMNSEKILQRIRMIMKEGFFYQKNMLIKLIQTPKKYPYSQIYSALTQLVEDNNEFIVDKYGRSGHLVNIGEYYLFQPIELNDNNLSIFERSVPIDYKHEMLRFELNPKPVNIREAAKPGSEKIIKELQDNFNLTMEFSKLGIVPRGDDNWYKHCGVAINSLMNDFPEMKQQLIRFLVAHMIELLLFQEKVELINYLYSLEEISENTLVWLAKEYFVANSIVSKKIKGIIFYDLINKKVMILNDDNIWVQAEPEDERELNETKEAIKLLNVDKNDFSTIVGFIGYEKNNNYLVFKTKNMTNTRNKGARCDESGKNKTIELLNTIIGEEKYTKENTKMIKDDGVIIQQPKGQIELCIIQEFILRFFNKIRKNKKIWFVTPEMAIFLKL